MEKKVLLFHGFMVHDNHDLRYLKKYVDENPIDNATFELVYLYDRKKYSSSRKRKMVKNVCKKIKEYQRIGYEVMIIGYSFSCILAAEISKKMKLKGVIYLAPTIQLFKSRLFNLHFLNVKKTIQLRLKHGHKKANKILDKSKIRGIIPLSYHITMILTLNKIAYYNKIPFLVIRGVRDHFSLPGDIAYLSEKSKAMYKKSITKIGPEYNHYFMYKEDIIKDFLYDEIKEFIMRF